MASNAAMYARFVMGMRSFVRQRVTIESARTTVRARMASREKNFIDLLDRAVFKWPRSPYNFLFAHAGCEPEEIRRMVRTEGVDAALSALYEAGVRLSFDEMKGRAPIVRGGRTFEGGSQSFDNPITQAHFESSSSGSTGRATEVRSGFEHLSSTIATMLLGQEANGTIGAPTLLYRPGMPDTTALNNIFRHIIVGNPVRRWMSPVSETDRQYPMRFRVAAALTPSLVRACGAPFPRMEFVPLKQAAKVAFAAQDFVRTEGRCSVRCSVSTALSVSIAAIENGIDLTNVDFTGGGEPSSTGKVNGIRASGARHITSYAMAEAGPVGASCGAGLDATDVHLLNDRLALVQRTTTVDSIGDSVGMFYLTTLFSSAPKILINVSTDDFGVVEERRCGCSLDGLGMHTHLRQIKSAGKLTGRGVTLVASDIAHIIEDVLPEKFGGTPQDYQLVEEEDKTGATHLHLLVSPSVALADESGPTRVLFEELSRGTPGAMLQSAVLRSADAIRVRRLEPQPSARGKLPAFKTVASK